MRKPRPFKRDAYVGIRMPDHQKQRLLQLSRTKLRDASNLGLTYIVEGMDRDERELMKQATGK